MIPKESSNIWNLLKKSITAGFFHIFGANVINKILAMATSMLLIRILSQQDYGAWSYALNVLSFVLLLQGMGAGPAALQYCSSAKDEKNRSAYFFFALKTGLIASLFLAIVCFCIGSFSLLPITKSNHILKYLTLLPFLTLAYELILVFLRSNLQNRTFSMLSVVNSIIFCGGSLVGGYSWGIIGVILARYLAPIGAIIAYLKSTTHNKISNTTNIMLLPNQKKDFLKFAFISMLTNAISSMLYLIDTFLVGIIIKDASVVATYKAATLIPFGLNFIPLSMMTFAYPYFARHFNNIKWIQKRYAQLISFMAVLNSTICLILFLCANKIVYIFFGANYGDSVLPFRILVIGYFIAGTFRIPAGNILAAIRKININFLNSMLSGGLNILLDIWLITEYGAPGAALATVSVFIISSLISNGFILKHVNTNSQY